MVLKPCSMCIFSKISFQDESTDLELVVNYTTASGTPSRFEMKRGEDYATALSRHTEKAVLSHESIAALSTFLFPALVQRGLPIFSFSISRGKGLEEFTLDIPAGVCADAFAIQAAEDHGLGFWGQCRLAGTIESQYSLLGVPQNFLPYPTGTFGFIHPEDGIPGSSYRTFSRLVLLSPAEHNTFRDNVQALGRLLDDVQALSGLALPYTIASEPDPDPSALHISFTIGEPRIQPRFYIAYNLEQLPFVPPSTRMLNKLRGALEIWDYSALNVAFFRERGIEARHVPFAYSPVYEDAEAPPIADKHACIQFLGYVADPDGNETSWRHGVLQQLAYDLKYPEGYRIEACQATCWGAERYRCQLGLNLPARPSAQNILEVHRIVPWISNGVYVVSPPSGDSTYDQAFEDLVDFTTDLAGRFAELKARGPAYIAAEAQRRKDALIRRFHHLDVMIESGALQSLLRRLGHPDAAIARTLGRVWTRNRPPFPLQIRLVTKHGDVAVEVHPDSDLEVIARKAYQEAVPSAPEAPGWEVTNIVNELERIMDEAGYPEQLRLWPAGMIGAPIRSVLDRQRFKRIKLHYEPSDRIWDAQLDAIAAAFQTYAERLGRALPVLKVSETQLNDSESLYILYAYGNPIEMPPFYIAVQMEQLTSWTPQNIYLRKLRGALEVWEYARSNVDNLIALGLDRSRVRFVPLVYGASMTRTTQVPVDRRYDVIFFGSMSRRRRELLPTIVTPLVAHNLSVRVGERIMNDDRFDALIAFNLHTLDWSIQEVHRILPLVANYVWVVSEPSNDMWYDARLAEIIDIVPTENIADRILTIRAMDRDAFRAEVARRRAVLVREWEAYARMHESGALDAVAARIESTSEAGPGSESDSDPPEAESDASDGQVGYVRMSAGAFSGLGASGGPAAAAAAESEPAIDHESGPRTRDRLRARASAARSKDEL